MQTAKIKKLTVAGLIARIRGMNGKYAEFTAKNRFGRVTIHNQNGAEIAYGDSPENCLECFYARFCWVD